MTLEVGMNLYTINGYERITIFRVTAKRAYVRIKRHDGESYELEFDREQNEVWIKRRGDHSRWSSTFYGVETPELIAKYVRYRKEGAFNNIKVNQLTDDQLSAILDIAKETP